MRARLSQVGRPLLVLGVAIASACTQPAAPVGASSTSNPIAASPSRRGPRIQPTHLLSSVTHTSTGSSGGATTGTGHTVFGSDDKLQYFGGRVISNVNVVMVEWTGAVDSGISAALPGFFSTIVTSPYFTWLAEYNTVGLTGLLDGDPGSNQTIGYGTVDTSGTGPGGAYVITPMSTSSTTVDDTDISEELVEQIGAGNLPAPELDGADNVNSLYVFDFPPSYTVTINLLGSTSCSDTNGFCGYHFTLQYGTSHLSVPYAVLMDTSTSSPCHTGCGGSSDYVANSTGVHSHELVEAITDTEIGISIEDGGDGRPIAWYDNIGVFSGESADLCDAEQSVVSGYTIQEIWSNAYGECISIAPNCDAMSPPAPAVCTPCYESYAAPCTGATPVCDMVTTSPEYGWCVGCASDTDCSLPTPICDPSTNACRACKSADCSGTTPICATSTFLRGQCVQCTESSQCPSSAPFCTTVDDVCVGCAGNSDCSGTTPICSGSTCAACSSDSQCSPEVCDTSSGACVQCNTNTECASGTCDTSTHTCTCSGDSQCKNPAPVCGSDKTCIACEKDGDCAGSPSGDVCSAGSCVQCTKSSDCMDPTPLCNTKTNTCEGGKSDGGAPPVDAGSKKKDSGSGGDAGTGTTTVGGCAATPAMADGGAGPVLAMAGLVAASVRRRRRAHRDGAR
jgi:MYXO-CTERM domain-containing protein